MTDDTLAMIAEQNQTNLRALATKAGVKRVLETSPPDRDATKVLTGEGGLEKSADDDLAEQIHRNARNLAALAEALGVRSSRIETGATSGDSEKVANVFLGGGR